MNFKHLDAKDFWICIALFVAALGVRVWLALQLPFPQLDDPAAYIQTARHLAEGRGLVTDVIWNYWVPFNTLTHPSNEFWMPLASLMMAATIKLLGDTLFAAQLGGIICGSLLVVSTYWMGRTLWPQPRRWSVLAALLLVPGVIVVFQAVSADSAALYALLSTLALFCAAMAIQQRRFSLAIAAAVLCGLSYLTRSHGLLLPAAIGLIWAIALRREWRLALKFDVALIVIFFALIGPWWLRNVAAFDATQPIPLTTIIASREYADWYNYTDQPTLQSMLALGWPTIINLRIDALLKALGVIVLITFPYGLVGLPTIYVRRDWLFRLFAVYGTLLVLGVAIVLPSSSTTGALYHSVGSFAVFAALGSIVVIKRLFGHARTRLLAVVAYAIFIGLAVGQAVVAWPGAIARSHAEEAQFTDMAQWLSNNVPPGEPILTTQANSLNYASGYPALSVPIQQDASVLRQVAVRYGVRFVVITENSGLYPAALDDPAARATLVATLPGTLIYELQR